MTDDQATMDTVAAAERAASFREMHRPGEPLLLPNPWDAGSARVLASLGFTALATTSSGFAATFGRPDGNVSRDEALANAADIVAATGLPVSADLENGYADDPEGVAETARLAVATGLAGLSIEDYTGDRAAPFYDVGLATERITAAAEAIRSGPVPLVLTARAENLLRGNPDLGDTIARLQRYRDAGADVLYAPGLSRPEDIRAVVTSVGAPVNMLAWPGGPNVAELAELGVARISVGGAFAFVAINALATAAKELRESGTLGYWSQAAAGREVAAAAFR